MSTPGFTAEAALFNGDMRYQATAKSTVYGGIVQPVLFQGRVDQLYVPFPIPCLKPPFCFDDPVSGRRHCVPPSWGIWNPITQSCE